MIATYMGIDIDDMTIDELKAALIEMGQLYIQSSEQHIQDLSRLSNI